MSNIKITLPDGSVTEHAVGVTVAEVAADIGPGLAKAALAGIVDEVPVDLSFKLERDCSFRIITPKSPEALELMRHSASHVMAEAVGALFGPVKFGIGPAIENGFYYDFDMEHRLSAEDLPVIEAKMNDLIKGAEPFVRSECVRTEAVERMKTAGQDYKVEMIEELPDETVSFYRSGGFTDMCRGPHVPDAGRIGAFKLLSVAGSYWRGDARRKMLQRVYGTAFFDSEELEDHLHRLEEAKKRDHRRLGRELGLFSTDAEIAQGLVLWHPKLGMVRHLVEHFCRGEHLKRDYQMVYTPHIASEMTFQRSGHLENYAEVMYSPMDIDGVPYYIKPMNCPGHIKIYQSHPRSYRELPLRFCELGTVYRYEPSGTLTGMLRVRGFTQDDSHIFCTPEQLPDELEAVLELAEVMLKAFGYTYSMYLATRPEKYLGTETEWDRATEACRSALERRGLSYEIDEGGGVFYAPKIDIKVADSLGREWQGPTIQVDLNLPKRLSVTYIGTDNAEHEVAMIHRTVLGSMERFIGGLIEHYGGAFPTWLAPVQVRVLPISDRYVEHSDRIVAQLREHGLRVETDNSASKMGHKIREATLAKVPYMLVVGQREADSGQVSVRHRAAGDLGSLDLSVFIERIEEEVRKQSGPETHISAS